MHFGHLIVVLIALLWVLGLHPSNLTQIVLSALLWVLGLHPSNLTQIVLSGTSQIRKNWKYMFSQCRMSFGPKICHFYKIKKLKKSKHSG